MACLRGDSDTQAALINCVLGNYLRRSMYVEADKFLTKVTFPETANNNELARYVFYTGRVKTMLFEYSDAQLYLAQAIRKAPQHDATAIGFKQIVGSPSFVSIGYVSIFRLTSTTSSSRCCSAKFPSATFSAARR